MKAMDTATAKRKGIKLRATIIYRKDGEVLFVRKRKAKWNLPGGRVERDETPLEAAMREMAEETGLAFDELRYLTMFREDKVIHYLFEAGKADDKPRPRNEIEACRWIKARDVAKRRVRRPIKTLLKRCA
ncbi:NUDIX domain-containing protein [Pseudomonas monteilii]|uniref:NUDIX domain-containing protein n=1 Tax=Pseudomonas TaxID=286 RepID=UPI0005A9ADB2|nr:MULTISPECIES: NUDIX domain-containing protein [Pseudomonas]MBA1314956.1 NUDIX domain-containing protein [Pseudomonas monteilii]MBA6089538.1 NUDIX domain-containing protein [Pseudomonas monteilii]MCE1017077.1 NUDIX domain-containing protein [Pseudomonas monteilii]MCE1033656.1 NUDIX domain-containing protein [Pseudomonas monteilii]MCE1085484.1 NUDIX domain-containing protein [Pseudomonas monteilii]